MILTVETVTRRLAERGVQVIETTVGMTGERMGWYDHTTLTIALHPDLLERQKLPVLLHEALHHSRQDQGHQSPAVEARIDEQVALMLVDPVDYAFCESQFGWSTGGIAAELDLPRWVIQAYRRSLARAA